MAQFNPKWLDPNYMQTHPGERYTDAWKEYMGSPSSSSSGGGASNPQDLWSSSGFKDYIANQGLQNPFAGSSDPYSKKLSDQWYKNVEKNFLENADKPMRPQFESILDKNGKLKSNFQLNYDPAYAGISDIWSKAGFQGYDPTAINAYQNEALRSGPSAWNELMKKQLGMQTEDQLNQNIQQAMGAQAAAQSDLAMRGGLSSGARERGAENLSRSIHRGNQGVRRSGMESGLNIDIQDEQNRLGALANLPGMQLALANAKTSAAQTRAGALSTAKMSDAEKQFQANQLNQQAYLNEMSQKRGFDMGNYSELMKAWGAGKTADAAGGGGGKK